MSTTKTSTEMHQLLNELSVKFITEKKLLIENYILMHICFKENMLLILSLKSSNINKTVNLKFVQKQI